MSQTSNLFFSSTTFIYNDISSNCYYNLLTTRPYRKEYVFFISLCRKKSLTEKFIVAEAVRSGVVDKGGKADIFQ